LKILCISAALVSIFVSVSCHRHSGSETQQQSADIPARDPVALAVIGEKHITLADFTAELDRRSRLHDRLYETEEQRGKLLDEMIQFEVLLAKARAAGYDQHPEIKARLNQFIVARFQEDQLAAQPAPITPSETEVRSFYEQNQERFTTPAAIRAALIHFKSSPKATGPKREELKQKAEAARAEARESDAAGFSRLAQKYSEDQATRYAGGDMGWLTRDSVAGHWEEAVLNAAFAIPEPGHLSPLVETPQGFYIIRLMERKPSAVRPLAQVKDAITYELAQRQQHQRQLDFHEEMKRGLKIETHPELLKLIPAPEQTSEARPPPLPGS